MTGFRDKVCARCGSKAIPLRLVWIRGQGLRWTCVYKIRCLIGRVK
jgi:hypothetical protein